MEDSEPCHALYIPRIHIIQIHFGGLGGFAQSSETCCVRALLGTCFRVKVFQLSVLLVSGPLKFHCYKLSVSDLSEFKN